MRSWLAYWRWRFRLWAVLPCDCFADLMRQVDYRITEVRHDYVIAEALTYEALRLGGPTQRMRVARPLPRAWWTIDPPLER